VSVQAADAERCDRPLVPAAVRCWEKGSAHVREVTKAGSAIEAVVAAADCGTTTGFRTGLERIGLRYAVVVRGFLNAWQPQAVCSSSLEPRGDRRALPERE
jgi:hypothetical protein